MSSRDLPPPQLRPKHDSRSRLAPDRRLSRLGRAPPGRFGSRGLFCYDFDGNRKWERELDKTNIVMQFGEGGSPALHGDLLIVNRDHQGDSHVLAVNKHIGKTVWKLDRDEPTRLCGSQARSSVSDKA